MLLKMEKKEIECVTCCPKCKFKYKDNVDITQEIVKGKQEVFNLYLKELKRVKKCFDDLTVKEVIQSLIYFSYNNKIK